MSDAVEKLENEFARFFGVAGAVATGFGRGAVWLALETLDVKGGDVLVPDFICAQVPDAVRRAGARPVFYRVNRDLAVSAMHFEVAITPNTRVAVIAHYFGRLLPNIAELAEICREHGIRLIEDCALAMEASLNGRRGGSFGELAVFSFTKSDWCYGGGMLTSNQPALLSKARALRKEKFRAARLLSFRYGLLRRADFTANRPRLARAAEAAGRRLERLTGSETGNFYDSGRFDAALPEFAASRARRSIAEIAANTARRQQIMRQLVQATPQPQQILLRPQYEPGDTGSFVLVKCPAGFAEDWIKQAAGKGVTLRRCWPAYQDLEPGQASAEVKWLADHLLLLELHPRIGRQETTRIAQVLAR